MSDTEITVTTVTRTTVYVKGDMVRAIVLKWVREKYGMLDPKIDLDVEHEYMVVDTQTVIQGREL